MTVLIFPMPFCFFSYTFSLKLLPSGHSINQTLLSNSKMFYNITASHKVQPYTVLFLNINSALVQTVFSLLPNPASLLSSYQTLHCRNVPLSFHLHKHKTKHTSNPTISRMTQLSVAFEL